jgi:hypothetical protein
MFEVALRDAAGMEDATKALRNCFALEHTGIEKVMSTMGIHEVDGYGRLFASIGLAEDVASIFGIRNYCGSAKAGLTIEKLDTEMRARLAVRHGHDDKPPVKLTGTSGLTREYRRQPYVWSTAGKVARKEERYETFVQKLARSNTLSPIPAASDRSAGTCNRDAKPRRYADWQSQCANILCRDVVRFAGRDHLPCLR